MQDMLIIDVKDENTLRKQSERLAAYSFLLGNKDLWVSAHKKRNFFNKIIHSIRHWGNRESRWEKKTYSILERWKNRHPLIAIFICTILGGIFISLVAGIILEATLCY